MDLADFDQITAKQEAGVFVEIEHPATGKPIGLRVRVASYESKRAAAANGKIVRDSARERPRGARVTPEDALTDLRKLLAACAVAWEFDADLTLDGEKPECTPENALAMFQRFPWIAEQLDVAANDRLRFYAS